LPVPLAHRCVSRRQCFSHPAGLTATINFPSYDIRIESRDSNDPGVAGSISHPAGLTATTNFPSHDIRNERRDSSDPSVVGSMGFVQTLDTRVRKGSVSAHLMSSFNSLFVDYCSSVFWKNGPFLNSIFKSKVGSAKQQQRYCKR
jgi:hypothetical protein